MVQRSNQEIMVNIWFRSLAKTGFIGFRAHYLETGAAGSCSSYLQAYLGRPLGYLTFSLMALIRDPIY